jgi:hypothetical protein
MFGPFERKDTVAPGALKQSGPPEVLRFPAMIEFTKTAADAL